MKNSNLCFQFPKNRTLRISSNSEQTQVQPTKWPATQKMFLRKHSKAPYAPYENYALVTKLQSCFPKRRSKLRTQTFTLHVQGLKLGALIY